MQAQMQARSASWALKLLPLFLLLLAATTEATKINITNQCSYTVWPAALPMGIGGGGRELKPGQVWTLDVPAGMYSGRIWARTGCSFSRNGKGSCQTGDCGGALACNVSGRPPNTLAQFSTGSTQDFFDISVIDGFNVPMDFLPVRVQGVKKCSTGMRCAADITSQCPEEIKVPGGCNNTCTGIGYSNCTYLGFFERMCQAYSLQDDVATHACPAGTNYQVIFCPPSNLALPPGAMSPPPTPMVETTPSTSPMVETTPSPSPMVETTPSPSSPPLAQ